MHRRLNSTAYLSHIDQNQNAENNHADQRNDGNDDIVQRIEEYIGTWCIADNARNNAITHQGMNTEYDPDGRCYSDSPQSNARWALSSDPGIRWGDKPTVNADQTEKVAREDQTENIHVTTEFAQSQNRSEYIEMWSNSDDSYKARRVQQEDVRQWDTQKIPGTTSRAEFRVTKDSRIDQITNGPQNIDRRKVIDGQLIFDFSQRNT